MHKGEISRLVGARQDVPLVVGTNGEESFIASDVSAILAHTNRVIFLEEGDVADVRPTGVEVTGVDGSPRERVVTVIDWSPEAAEKGGYDHFMLKEIHEQPEGRSASRPPTGGYDVGRCIRRPEVDGPRGRVPARDAGRAGRVRHGAGRRSGRRRGDPGLDGPAARVTVGSEFRYSPPPLDADTLVIAVTQSGETADTIAPTRWAREQGCPIVAVTNTVGSRSPARPDAVRSSRRGPEIAVAASKTFVTQVTTLIVLGGGDCQGTRRVRGRAGAGAGSRPSCAP